jgi:hypothetical protein
MMRFLPAPWVVAPEVKPPTEPTSADKMPEPAETTRSSLASPTTSTYAAQPEGKTTDVPSYDQRQTVRRVLKTPVDCWSPQGWSSPECVKYRSRNRQ